MNLRSVLSENEDLSRCVLVLLICCMAAVFLLFPFIDMLKQLKNDNSDTAERIAGYRALGQQGEEIQKLLSHAEKRMKETTGLFYSSRGEAQTREIFLKEIRKTAKKHNITIISKKFQPTVTFTPSMNKFTVVIKCTGGVKEYLEFLLQLAQSKPLIIAESQELKTSHNDLLSATLRFSFYQVIK